MITYPTTQIREVVKLRQEICEAIPQLIRQSGKKEKFFYERIGLSRNSWIRRKKLNQWTDDQLLKIEELL